MFGIFRVVEDSNLSSDRVHRALLRPLFGFELNWCAVLGAEFNHRIEINLSFGPGLHPVDDRSRGFLSSLFKKNIGLGFPPDNGQKSANAQYLNDYLEPGFHVVNLRISQKKQDNQL